MEAALLALVGRGLRGWLALFVGLAVRRVVVLGRGLDAGERLPAFGASDWLVVRLRGGGRVVARLVANWVVACGRLVRRLGPSLAGASAVWPLRPRRLAWGFGAGVMVDLAGGRALMLVTGPVPHTLAAM